MEPVIVAILSVLGIAYLIFIIALVFKERGFTLYLVLFNIAVFIYVNVFNPELLTRFALSGFNVSHGMGYTVVTYMFLHAGLGHLLLNSLGLLFFGYNIEKEFGPGPMFAIYITSGLVGGAFYVWTSPENAMVVGASAAIFGLMAYLTLIRPFQITPMPFVIPMPVALAAVIYTIAAAPLVFAASLGGVVAYNAHIGGLIGGSLMAFGMNRFQALKGLIVVLALAIIVLTLPTII